VALPAVEHLVWEGIKQQRRASARVRRTRIDLGNSDVDAECIDRRQGEESLALRTCAGINQGTAIRVVRREHAIERRRDLLEGLQLLEPADIGGLRINGGLCGVGDEQAQDNAGEGGGQRGDNDEGIEPGLKIHYDQ
jgi:hypothetical protein